MVFLAPQMDYTSNGFAGRVFITVLGKKLRPLVTMKFHTALPAGVSVLNQLLLGISVSVPKGPSGQIQLVLAS